VQILGVERLITEHLGLTVWTQRPSEKVKILKLWVLVLRPIWKRCSPRNLTSNVRININICIKISFCISRAFQPLHYRAVASELWGQGVHCSPQVQDLYPMYPPSQRCGLCQNFKQTILTTGLYNVRTNLYPPHLRKRSDAPATLLATPTCSLECYCTGQSRRVLTHNGPVLSRPLSTLAYTVNCPCNSGHEICK